MRFVWSCQWSVGHSLLVAWDKNDSHCWKAFCKLAKESFTKLPVYAFAQYKFSHEIEICKARLREDSQTINVVEITCCMVILACCQQQALCCWQQVHVRSVWRWSNTILIFYFFTSCMVTWLCSCPLGKLILSWTHWDFSLPMGRPMLWVQTTFWLWEICVCDVASNLDNNPEGSD